MRQSCHLPFFAAVLLLLLLLKPACPHVAASTA
jgi:hypothetical protein